LFQRAIVRVPSEKFAAGLTTVSIGTPDYGRALEQHEAYCAVLEQCGLRLTRLEADQRYPDSTFVEDTAVLTKRCAVVTNPGAPSRAGEIEDISKTLALFYSELHFIREPGTLDGGDVCEAGNHFFIGISERTNEAGAQRLAELLTSFDYSASLVDIRDVDGVLHLKSGLAYLSDNRLVVIEALHNRVEFRGYDLVRVNTGEEYAANCVSINGCVLVAAGHPTWEGKLRELGYETVALDMSEFQKMDGGLSCLSLRF
jgi:dimethylargininase